MEFFNSLNLKQIKGGTKLKQGDLGSVLSYSLTDENGQEITSFDTKTAYINLVLDDKIWFTTTTLVDISRVTFRIDKAIPIGLYYLEIKIDDYIFPSDRDSIILIEKGSTPYDLKELVPNYDTNMTIKGILSDLRQKGIDISDLNRRIENANAELIASRNGKSNLKTRIDDLENKTTAQLAEKANKDEVTNVMTPKGNIAYASLPMTGNSVGWYYYCPDGDGTHGAGNYVWNGTSWFFGGTGDEGYNLLKKDIVNGLIYEYNAENGYVAFNTGYINDFGDIKNTGFLPVKKGMIIKVKGIAFPDKDYRGLALYDTNKSFIKGYQYNENDVYKFEVKRDGYLNCTIVGNDITIIANQNGISNAMFYIEQDVNSTLTNRLNNIIVQKYSTAKQLEIVDTQEGYAVKSDGSKENAGWLSSLKFLCEPYQKIFTKKANSHQNYPWIVLFDKNNNVVGSTNLNESGGGEIIAPQNVAYGWMNCYQLVSSAMTQLYTEELNENILPDKFKRLNDKSNPLSNLLENGGYTTIFNKISCIGDSLTEGVFEYTENGEVKYAGIPQGFESYSYPSQLARMTGATVGNYGVGGATAKSWLETTACTDCFKAENKSQAYIIALGTNDTNYDGNVDTDIDISNYNNNADTFVGNYAKIIQKCLELQPKAKVFVVTIPKTRTDYHHAWTTGNSQIKAIANKLGVYVLDVFTYSESHDNPDEYKNHFYLGGHRSAIGYKQTALEYATYISWIIYNNPDDFRDVQYIGTDYEFTN